MKHVGALGKEMAEEAAASSKRMAEQVGNAHAAMARDIERAQQSAEKEVARAQATMRTEFKITDRAVADLARGQQRAASQVERAQAGMASGSERHFGRMADAAKNAAGIMGTALAGITVATGKAAAHDAYTLDVAMTRLKALAGNVTPDQADRLQKQAEGSPFIGAPAEVAAGYTAAVQSGITSPDAMIASVEAAKAFQIAAGRSTGELPGLAEAEKMILEHAQMLGDITDEMGRRITPKQATPGQLTRAELSAAGRLETFAQAGGGDSNKAYEFNKFAAPSALAARVPVADLLKMGAQLGRNGIQGSLAGVAMRSITGSLLAPTAKARTQFRELGIDYSKFVDVDASRMDDAKIANAMELRAGPLNARTRSRLAADLDAFKRTHDLTTYQDSAARDLQASGSRNMRNPVSAQTLARDASTGFVTKLDVEGMLAALKAAGASIGAYNQIFGSRQGGNAALIDPAAIAAPDGIRSIIRQREPEAMGAAIIEEQRRSYSATMDAGGNAVTGTLTSLFEPWKAPIADVTRQFIGLSAAIRGLSDPQKAAIGGAGLGVALSGGVLSLRWLLGLVNGKPSGMPRPGEVPPAMETGAAVAKPTAAETIRANAEAEWRAVTGEKAITSGTSAGRAMPVTQTTEEAGTAIGRVAGKVMGETFIERFAGSGAARMLAAAARGLGVLNPIVDVGTAGYMGYEAGTDPRYKDTAWLNAENERRAKAGVAQFAPLEPVDGIPLPPGAPTVREQEQANRVATVAKLASDAKQAATLAATAATEQESGNAGAGGSTVRMPVLGEFLVPPAGKSGQVLAVPAAAPPPVRVEGEAEVRQMIDVRLTGSDVFADAISRRIENRVTVNLGSGMTGGQGLQPQPAFAR